MNHRGTEDTEKMELREKLNLLSGKVIGAAIEVHQVWFVDPKSLEIRSTPNAGDFPSSLLPLYS